MCHVTDNLILRMDLTKNSMSITVCALNVLEHLFPYNSQFLRNCLSFSMMNHLFLNLFLCLSQTIVIIQRQVILNCIESLLPCVLSKFLLDFPFRS